MHHAHSDDIVYGDGYALIPASRIEPETVDWLWQNRIPRGETIVLEGDPGVGKSILAATLVAAITTGGSMPGGPELDQGFCLIANLEDHRGAVTRPRLEAAGADLDLAIIIKMEDRGYERPVRLPDDLDRIERMIVEKGAELLIVDPLAAALAPDVNMNSDQEVREALGPLAQIGREHGTTILILRHLNKNIGASAIHRGAGSTGIGGLARCVLQLAKHPHERGKIVLTQTKTNAGIQAKGIVMRIEAADNGAGRIYWEDEVDLTSDDVLSGQGRPGVPAKPTKRDECEAWLREALANGPMPGKEVEASALEAGFTIGTVRRTRESIGIKVEKERSNREGQWVWSLEPPAERENSVGSESGEGLDAQPAEGPAQDVQDVHLVHLIDESGGETPDRSPEPPGEANNTVLSLFAQPPSNVVAFPHQRTAEREGLDAQDVQDAHVVQEQNEAFEGVHLVAEPGGGMPVGLQLMRAYDLGPGPNNHLVMFNSKGTACPECQRAERLPEGYRCNPCHYRIVRFRS